MRTPISIAVALALAGPAVGQEARFDWLAVSGFGTLATSMTDDPAVGFRMPFQKNVKADTWATDVDSKLGLQFDVNRGGEFSGVLQVVAQQRDKGDYKAEVEWANVMWTINDSWRVRAGRMVTPVFMLSDSQNVGYSMVPVRYAREMGDNYPLSRHDGAEVIFGAELGPGRLQVQAFGGVTSYNTASTSYKADAIFGAAATYSTGPWTFRASGTSVQLKAVGNSANSLSAIATALANPALAPLCPNCKEESQNFQDIVDGSSGVFFGLGMSYDEGAFYGHAEYGIRQGSAIVPDTSGLLLLGAYRWRTLTPFISYSMSTTSIDEAPVIATPAGSPAAFRALAGAVNGVYYGQATDRSAITIGSRWDFYRNVALKVQAEFIEHEYDSIPMGGTWPRVAGTTYDGKVNLYTASIDFIF
ncbi:hypothetical protein OPU71_15540 [Niveibacterium sp. 24ML]|uniref:hypothetical protein n=1 Tax=Niveibacterium sp. 24ML TaxID=2985512 RepID=UPI00226DDB90|nr:hypothetical protein [Niveibacterium sp. 24ML]MCX9157541.1 hypothetical protein [Niveibacterium sp. 24ML]